MFDFLEESYIKPLIKNGYLSVKDHGLPDGTYFRGGGGYKIEIYPTPSYPVLERTDYTGITVITGNGTTHPYNGNEQIIIKDGKFLETNNDHIHVYKIMKEVRQNRHDLITEILNAG